MEAHEDACKRFAEQRNDYIKNKFADEPNTWMIPHTIVKERDKQ